MKKRNSAMNSMWTAVLWGVVVSVLFSILGAAIGAAVVNAGGVRENGIKWLSALIWAVSVFCGIMLTLKLCKENLILTAGITAGGYVLIMTAVNLLFLNQHFSGLGRAVLAVLAGSVGAVLLNLNWNKSEGRKTRYRPR